MRKISASFVLFGFFFGCAGTPIRPTLREDVRIPSGKIEGNQFTGIRYPFTVSFPLHWIVTTEFPDIMETLGYNRPSSMDNEQAEVYAFNPETKANMQFDFTPAGPYATFNQEKIQLLATAGTESMKSELKEAHGKNVVNLTVGSTEPASLKGVPYAAKKFVTYTLDGVMREQGWVYGFSEPYQIFILYMVLGKEGANDRGDIDNIIDSFRIIANSAAN